MFDWEAFVVSMMMMRKGLEAAADGGKDVEGREMHLSWFLSLRQIKR